MSLFIYELRRERSVDSHHPHPPPLPLPHTQPQIPDLSASYSWHQVSRAGLRPQILVIVTAMPWSER